MLSLLTKFVVVENMWDIHESGKPDLDSLFDSALALSIIISVVKTCKF